MRLVVLVILIGFPIALVIACAFELTPEGTRAGFSDAPRSSTRVRLDIESAES